MEATDLIRSLLEGFKAVAKTETIVGEGIKVGEYTLLPVSRVSLGIGAGAGAQQIKVSGGSGGMGGGGICVVPIAFLVVKEGEVSILNLRSGGAMMETFFGRFPEMVEKAVNIVKGKKAEPTAG